MAVNLSPYGGVGAQFLDNAGNVLTGGRIETYAAGTTTPQATYTTSAGLVFHTNPIILDASGRVPSGGEIWLTDGLQYKFVLRDSNNVLIATYDNIVGINSNFVNFVNQQEIQIATAGQTVFTLATTNYSPGTNSLSVFVDGVNQYGPGALYAYLETNSTTVTFVNGLHVGAEVKFTTSQLNSSGATAAAQVSFTGFKGQTGTVQDLADDDGSDWIGFEQAGVGAVAISAQDKMRQTVSVKDFGAVGDGVADDTVAIQASVDYAANNNLTLFFPDGIYQYTNITVPSTKPLSIVGSSKENAVLKQISPWTASTAGIIATGSFYAQNIGFDQNWIKSLNPAVVGYNDSNDPNTWGGYFIADINTESIVNIQNCNFLNVNRGMLITNASSVDFFNNYADCTLSPAQSVCAVSKSIQVSMDCNTMVAPLWTSGTGVDYGLSGLFSWGCSQVEVSSNNLKGFQFVQKGMYAEFTGSISGTTLTVSAVASGSLIKGMVISGTNVFSGSTIVSQLSGTTNGVGTYELSISQTLGSTSMSASAQKLVVSNNIIDTPIADTACFNWKLLTINNNIVRMSGDMGITFDGVQYATISNNVVDGTRIGGIATFASIPAINIVLTGNVIKDIAQGSQGIYANIDQFGRFASNGGNFLAAISVGFQNSTQGGNAWTVTGNTTYFENYPPVSDSNGPVRANVFGIYFESSSNTSAQITGVVNGNYVLPNYAIIPKFFVQIMTHRFYHIVASATGTPIQGEQFTNGGNSFILHSISSDLVFLKKLIGTIPSNTVFTGALSGATITSNATLPALTWLGLNGAGNMDWTTNYDNSNLAI
jgi:hypothetical protein